MKITSGLLQRILRDLPTAREIAFNPTRARTIEIPYVDLTPLSEINDAETTAERKTIIATYDYRFQEWILNFKV